MEVYITRIPQHCTDRDLKIFFRGPLAEFNIDVFLAQKFRGKPSGRIVFLETDKGWAFLSKYGLPINQPRARPLTQLTMNGLQVICKLSTTPPEEFLKRDMLLLRSLALEAERKREPTRAQPPPDRNRQLSTFAISSLQCGVWCYVNSQLTFESHFADNRSGNLTFGHHQAAVLLNSNDFNGSISMSSSSASRVNISYHSVDTVTTGGYNDSAITFTLECPPKFYRSGSDMADMMASLMLNMRIPGTSRRPKRVRMASINPAHAPVVGTCFVYRISLADAQDTPRAFHLIKRIRNIRSVIPHQTLVTHPVSSRRINFGLLDSLLADPASYGTFTFDIKYQLLRLAHNGILSPEHVMGILSTVSELRDKYEDNVVVDSIQRLYRSLPPIGPHTHAHDYSRAATVSMLQEFAQSYNRSRAQNPYELKNRHAHIALIHKLTVTPAGTYLEGPEPEVTNRILRDYESHSNHFLRVTFIDEDGESVRFDPRADQTEIYHTRFRGFMDKSYMIAGRRFSFLGFSHSSLRSQTCWFMAPFQFQGTLMLALVVIRRIGDFGHIKTPARCAARIGQAFTDTTGTVEVEAGVLGHIPDVKRNGRVFSDGVGTISESLLKQVWKVYGIRRSVKPTVLQIRYAGAKGVISLDTRLKEDQFNIRPSMEKFTGSNATKLEVCGAAWRPYPMILNRQYIKILEDLGVAPKNFIDLQNEAVGKLRMMTTSTLNASIFLQECQTSKAAQLPNLLELLYDIGLDYKNDPFLRGVVEMAVITKLRDIKYRGRIPVENGVTLYGIMDETGFLQENQIYVVVKSSYDSDKMVLTGGNVIVTRSPALHPGDIRVVEAVDVPANSPLDGLQNCVVFSQHGARDLPSQLSGGDLDGDLYNVIFDPNLMPKTAIAEPADYPRITGKTLDREVTVQDMSDFFIEFMETDMLGPISVAHLQIADQKENGVLDPDCIKLAQMASTAVDFSKTGIPVDMKDMPRYSPIKPDFMAPTPRAIIHAGGISVLAELEENEDEDDPVNELEPDFRCPRYYRSEKVLGHLYRAIDEHQFLEEMQRANKALASEKEDTVLSDLWDYVQRYTVIFQWDHYLDLAKQIREGYEQALLQALYQYASSPHHPLTEMELFSGTILGGGKLSKRVREMTQAMREQFEEILQFTVSRIVNGDFEGFDRNEEALPRAIACLAVAMTGEPFSDKKIGELESWKYIAAGVCLREMKRWYAVDMGKYTLPHV